MGNTQSEGVDLPVLVDGKYAIAPATSRQRSTNGTSTAHKHTAQSAQYNDKQHIQANDVHDHTASQPYNAHAHSPHLQLTGTDQHDVSMHDIHAHAQNIDQSQQPSDVLPPLKLDNDTGMARAGSHSGNEASHQQSQHQQSIQQRPIETVPTAFKWTHNNDSPDSQVYLTGSFNNWQGKILMYKQDDGEYALIIDIPPGIHHYKYIVDGEWRLDEDAPTVIHNQVENNIIEVKRPVFEYTPASYADSDDDEAESQHTRAPYSQRAPLSSDYVQEPPRMPPHLSQSQVALNHTSSRDPTWLPIPQHVMINHLYVLDGTHTDLVVTGITQRFKPNKQTRITHKFVTTVYYVPRQQFSNTANMPFNNYTQSGPGQLSLNVAHSSPAGTPHMQSVQQKADTTMQQTGKS